MVYAVVARPPVYGGKVVSFDAAETLKVPGVLKVVEIEPSAAPAQFNPLGGVAVVGEEHLGRHPGPRGPSRWSGTTGRTRSYDSTAFKAQMEESARKPGKVVRDNGNVDTALAGGREAASTAEYYIPHLAHAPMEPPAATVRIVNGKAEAWACVQSPQAARDLRGQAARHARPTTSP